MSTSADWVICDHAHKCSRYCYNAFPHERDKHGADNRQCSQRMWCGYVGKNVSCTKLDGSKPAVMKRLFDRINTIESRLTAIEKQISSKGYPE